MVKKHVSKFQKRSLDTHKGDFGHVLVVAGSRGMTGAAYLTSQAALLSGSGLVTCAIPESLNSIMEVKSTEVMTLPLPETKRGAFAASSEKEILEFSKKVDAIAIGPGISRQSETQKLVRSLIAKLNKPLILDADGIIACAANRDILKKREYPTIVTPHPGEMARLLGEDIHAIQADRKKIAVAISRAYRMVVVLKGYRTVISNARGNVYVNKTGNSGMSTAGVGDVLTGIITSFVGQGIDPYSAALVGAYLHGLAGDLAARDQGQFSLIATDLLNYLPRAILKVL